MDTSLKLNVSPLRLCWYHHAQCSTKEETATADGKSGVSAMQGTAGGRPKLCLRQLTRLNSLIEN